MNPRLIKAKKLMEVLLTGRELTAEQAQLIVGTEELSRVIEVIRCQLYVPVTCRRDKPTSYLITPDDLSAYHNDRGSQIKALKAKKYANEYTRLRQRLIKKALLERGGISRTKTLLRQVEAVITQYEANSADSDRT
ncbi:MAG: hypothetical protein L0G80_02960 [Shewanella sp.]|uniref:hypothetical protein n=1 Tax=Shewanella sp. TaxID=50422 RepID=UPI00264713CB|nr:hypothetical protein [Shewanella sp.]MDN5498870.1 hypothetical protein [Shewanella sp.]MDN5526728.1 hypothetical protein [Shewanella sp.]